MTAMAFEFIIYLKNKSTYSKDEESKYVNFV